MPLSIDAPYREPILQAASLIAGPVQQVHPYLDPLLGTTFLSETWLAHHLNELGAAITVTMRLGLPALVGPTPRHPVPSWWGPFTAAAPAEFIQTDPTSRFQLWRQMMPTAQRVTVNGAPVSIDGVMAWVNLTGDDSLQARVTHAARDLINATRTRANAEVLKSAAYWGFWMALDGDTLARALDAAVGPMPSTRPTREQQQSIGVPRRAAAAARYVLTGDKLNTAEEAGVTRSTVISWIRASAVNQSIRESTMTLETLREHPALAWMDPEDYDAMFARTVPAETAALLESIVLAMRRADLIPQAGV